MTLPWADVHAGRRPRPEAARRAAVLAGVVAAVLALAWLAGPDTGTDLAAQQARAAFARDHPLTPVDLRWYAGVQPAAYSVLSPLLMAALGVRLTGALAAVVAAAALGWVAGRTGGRRPRLTALLLAAGCVGDIVSGRVTFACGLAAAALAVALLVAGRRGAAGATGVVTTLLSPLAGLFLLTTGLAISSRAATAHLRPRRPLVLRRAGGRPGTGRLRRAGGGRAPGRLLRAGRLIVVSAGVPLALLAVVVPEPGRMTFTWSSAWRGVGVALLVALVTRGVPRRLALLLAAGIGLAFVVPGPVGSNALRLVLVLAPAGVAAAARGPRLVVAVALGLALALSVGDPWRDLSRGGAPAREEGAAHRLQALLHGLPTQPGRLEIVPLRDHGEAAVLQPLARGWLRQVDRVRSPLFYVGRLDDARYRSWLADRAVGYVALARLPLDWAARDEAALLRAGVPGLDRVADDGTWTVWRVRDVTPLAPGLVSAGPDAIVADLPAGASLVRVRPGRWTVVDHGCWRPRGDAIEVRESAATRVRISSSYTAPFAGSRC